MKIVQIGANRGYDELTSIVNCAGNIDFLLLIEPLEKFNESLKKCYSSIKNLIIENCAITDKETEKKTTFYLHNKMDSNCEQSSVLKSHVIKHFLEENDLQEKIVDCITINSLFNKYDLKNVDILFIDAEGFDDKIIESINFDKFTIDKIYYENRHIDNEKIKKFLTDNKYIVQDGINGNVHNSIATKIKN